MSELLDAWAAGIIDGEGCITIKRRGKYFALIVTASQAELDGGACSPIITQLHELYGGSLDRQLKKGRRRATWAWTVATKQAETCLRRITPYLVGKKAEAELALEYRATVGRPGRRSGGSAVAYDYYVRLRKMKHYEGGSYVG